MAAGISDGDLDDQEKGPLVYQESKKFHGETFLINTYDNTKKRNVDFEVYGLDTQEQLHILYNYNDFDGLFRFNAELMNPNRKEGRFHWIAERLAIVTVGKERKLKLNPEPTEEVPELPIYETIRKIPTGRMDLKERQRLREAMDMLSIKRNENIQKRKQASRQRFLKHVFWLKEEEKRLRLEHDAKLADERLRRVQMKEDTEKRTQEADKAEKERQRQRKKSVEVKEERTEEQDAEEYRQLRARWKMRDNEAKKAIDDARARKAKDLAELNAKKAQDKANAEKTQNRRESMWAARNERIKKKNNQWLRNVLEVKSERMRNDKMRTERNQEYLRTLHALRQPIFAAQIERTKEREQAAIAISESTAAYHEKRSVPKKVKKKGKNAAKTEGKEDKKGKAKDQADTDKVLDAVEAKMRAEMDELAKRARMDAMRTKKINSAQEARKKRFMEHLKTLREQWRAKESVQEEKANERRIIQQQKKAEAEAAAERKKQELDRLRKMREANIAKKEKERIARMAAALTAGA